MYGLAINLRMKKSIRGAPSSTFVMALYNYSFNNIVSIWTFSGVICYVYAVVFLLTFRFGSILLYIVVYNTLVDVYVLYMYIILLVLFRQESDKYPTGS